MVLLLLAVTASAVVAVQQITPPYITSVAWSPDGTKIAVGYGTYVCDPDHPEFYDIEILDAQTEQVNQTLTGSLCDISELSWSPDSSRLAASSHDSVGVRVWNVQSGQLLATAERGGQGVGAVRWSPDGSLLAVGTISNVIVILDAATGNIVNGGLVSGVRVTWSPEGSQLASGSGYQDVIYVTNITTGQAIMDLTGHTGGLPSLDWSPDGSKIASGGGIYDPTVRVWDAVMGQNLLVLQGHNDYISDVRWSSDSSRLASAGDDCTVRIWDSITGTELEVFQYSGRVWAVDWSPDGSQIVFGGENGELQIMSTTMTPSTTTIRHSSNLNTSQQPTDQLQCGS